LTDFEEDGPLISIRNVQPMQTLPQAEAIAGVTRPV
jgi:hypothetical protein